MKDYVIGGIAVLSLVISIAVWSGTPSYGAPTVGAVPSNTAAGPFIENYIPAIMYNNGYVSAKDISTTGNLFGGGALLSGSGTTTLAVKSTSTTKGFCMEINATSSATVLNITATTTTSGTGGSSGLLVQFGACS